MTVTDWIGTTGVTILLVAFLLNLSGRMSQKSMYYIAMNLFGAALACLASILLNYWPFIILEAVWVVVSLWGLVRIMLRKQPGL